MLLRFVLCVCLAAAAPAAAQQPAPVEAAPAQQPAPPAAALPPPQAPPVAPTAAPQATLALSAQFARENRAIPAGLVWRVFPEIGGEQDKPLAMSTDAAPTFRLEPGSYILHVGYGMAGVVQRVAVGPRGASAQIMISAGALKLAGAIGPAPLPAAQMSFTIYAPLPNNSEGRLVAQNVKLGEIVRLPEGAYHVVSTYGDTNSIMRADLKVESGKVTEATMNHRAATVTLKLVANPGGEALAGTAFSVLTPGGDIIREAIGAFPSMILAEGEYVAIARNQGKVYQRPFKVDSGLDRDIEVLAK
jgi:hypothetical protein